MITRSRRPRGGARHCSMYARKMGPFIAPSITNGATIPSWRKPATKGIVLQCPWGTDASSRSTRGQRPLTRTMFVLVAVTSITPSRAGSSMPCSRIQRRRARATSARSCSAACRLFLKLTLCRSKKRWRALRLPGIPCLAIAASVSSMVKSGCLAIRAKIQSECSSNGETLPPLCLGAALPVSLQLRHHRITELTPTLKISAASRRDAPLSTASIARSRKSVEYGLGMDLAPRANQFLQIRLGQSTWDIRAGNGSNSRARFPLFFEQHAHSPLSGYHVSPKRIELLRTERITPWRHLIPAAGDRAQESIALLRRKFPQVEGALRSLHARTMTGRAIDRK